MIAGERPMHVGRRSGRLTLWMLAAGLIASLAMLAIAAQAHAAPRMDYGDAPDGADARYSIPVTGKFPSLLASSGPRHKSSGPSLGIGRDKEGDSKQVDRDRFDDGVSLDRLGQCGTSRLTVLVDTRKIPAKLLKKHDLYLNSWFDWDRSGAFGEANGCPGVDLLRNNEWAIVNQRIAGKAFLPKRVRAFSFKFKGGLHRGEFWTRATLTLGQKLPIDAASRSGGATAAPYAYGETEDYLVQRSPDDPPVFDESGKEKKKEKEEKEKEEKERKEKEEAEGPFSVSCIPNPASVEHGRAAIVRFFIKDEGKGLIFGKQLSPKAPGGNKTRILRHPNQKGVPQGYFRASGFRFKSSHRDARLNPVERHVVKFSFTRGKTKQILRCLVYVIHDKIVEPKKQHMPKPVPPAVVQPPVPPPPAPPPVVKQVQGQGFYQQDNINPQLYHMGVQFDQDVEGFRIKLNGEPPPTIFNAQSPDLGVACEVDTPQSVLCTGSIEADALVGVMVEFDPAPTPSSLEGRLELYAIQGGQEKGPFPMQPATIGGT